jgi:photosystem II stability/assembly factor-like uncharacterized protein
MRHSAGTGIRGRCWCVAVALMVIPQALGSCHREIRGTGEGVASLKLEATASSGTTYRLVGQFVIGGTTSLTVSTDDYPGQSVIDQALPVGNYTVTLAVGWQLLRRMPSGDVATSNAVLLSPQTQAFTILSGQVTPVGFSFEVDGQPVVVGGTIEISIGVTERTLDAGTDMAVATLTTGPTSSLSFGSVALGSSSVEQSFTITNSGQQMSGPITTTSEGNDFSIQSGLAGDCVSGATVLAGGASCTVRVVFSPQVLGDRSVTVGFSATPGGGGNVALSGIGTCTAGSHDGGDGSCVAVWSCASGYHNDGTGNCVINASCPPGKLTDGTGTCVPMAGAIWTQRATSQNWYAVASSADGTKLVAAVSQGYLYTSTDSGESWTQRATSQAWWAVASSANGIKLVAVSYNGGVHTSTDSGLTWTEQWAPYHQSWFGVASSADGTKLVATGFGGFVYTSTDSGVNWTRRSASENAQNWVGVASSADGTKLVALLNGGNIYTSTDSGETWTQRASSRSWYAVASSADGTKLAAVVYGGNAYTSTDSGATWTQRGIAQVLSAVASSADGSKLIAVAYGGDIYTSMDSGVTWSQPGLTNRWLGAASSGDGTKLVAVVNGGYIYTSGGPVP